MKRGYERKSGELIPYLPSDCWVKPLGYLGAEYFFETKPVGVVWRVPVKRLTRESIGEMFLGDDEYLEELWPVFDRARRVIGWNDQLAAAALMYAAAREGKVDPRQVARAETPGAGEGET